MQSFCGRCAQEAELQAAPDGGMYCVSCISFMSNPVCMDCIKCHQRHCGNVIYACSLCNFFPSSSIDPEAYQSSLKKERILPAITVDEKCERCGGTFDGPVLILNGKSLCRICVIYEQKKWEIIETKPGKSGTRIKIVFDKAEQSKGQVQQERNAALSLFQKIGIEPSNLPPNPFPDAPVLNEKRMPDDSCISCVETINEKKIRKFEKADGADGNPNSDKDATDQ